MTSQSERLDRARLSLEGLSVGDALGGYFEFWRGGMNKHLLKNRRVPDEVWPFTDDTNMALSIYANLRQHGTIKQDELAQSFAAHYEKPRAYGYGAIRLLAEIRTGGDWRDHAKNMFRGEGSFGNGGAMRVAPLGAYLADDMLKLIEQAKLSAEVTHAHPEGIAGAIAVAVAASIAWSYRGKAKPSIFDFISQVLPHIPASEVRDNCETARDVAEDTLIDDVVMQLGNGRNVAAMDTVPLSLWCAARWMDNYEEAIWQTIAAGGDVDTNCAIVGGIIALYTGYDGILKSWREHREQLPDWAFED